MTLFLCVSKSQAMALTTSPVQQAQHPNPNREARRGRPGALGWKLGVQGSSLTSVTAAQCDLGQVTCPVCTSVCSPAKGAGWDGDLPLTLPPSCDSPASPVWFRTHHPPPTLPKAACLPHLPFQKERPSPFLSVRGEPGRRWAADRDRRCGNNPGHSSRPPAGSAGPQPVSTAEIQRGVCLGDAGLHLNLRILLSLPLRWQLC